MIITNNTNNITITTTTATVVMIMTAITTITCITFGCKPSRGGSTIATTRFPCFEC